MKIVLILPFRAIAESPDLWMRAHRKMAYAPTTLTTLAALVPVELNATIELLDEGVEEVDVANIEADLVGISVITPNAERAYRMAATLRGRGITVVLGGVHVTLLPDEAAQHADAVVIGHAERSWPALLQDFQSGHLQQRYHLDSDGIVDGMAASVRDDLLKKKRYIFPNSIEATRGCINRCQFCVVPPTSRNQYGARSVADVVEEIRQRGGNDWVFLDPSPGGIGVHAYELMAALKDLKIRWYGSITTRQLRDPCWLDAAADSGCRGVLVGFESMNQRALRAVGKGFNQVDHYRRGIAALHERGISILACFMFGFDSDDKQVFRTTVDFVDETNLDLVHYGIFTPFPGTASFRRLLAQGRILTRKWSLYDCTRVVFQPAGMSPAELQDGYLWAYRTTHSYASILKRVLSSRCGVRLGLLGNLAFRMMGTLIERDVARSTA